MNTEWLTFLNEAGALSSGSPLIETNNGYSALPDHGLLRISGEDAETFLQGQLTADVKALPTGRTGFGALCNPKGRVIASFRLLRSVAAFWLLLPAELAEPVRKRLQTYVLRAKVRVEDLTPHYGLLGLFGTGCAPMLQSLGVPWPDSIGECTEDGDILAAWLDSNRRLIAASTTTAQSVWSALHQASTAIRLDPALWRLRSIEAGLPESPAAVSEEFLPQMLNLDLLDGIGFQKGCYTGQEIIARTHYLGQIKRRMFRLLSTADFAPTPGTAIYDAAGEPAHNVGQVVLSAPDPAGGWQALAVLALEQAQSPELRLMQPDGPLLTVLPLPYAPGSLNLGIAVE
jgi:folate-binding protein YgfZ